MTDISQEKETSSGVIGEEEKLAWWGLPATSRLRHQLPPFYPAISAILLRDGAGSIPARGLT